MILLTAQPRTGKSTAIKKIINMLGPNNCKGFYTEEIREDGERVGFRINTLSGKQSLLAHINIKSKYQISRYGVDLAAFEETCIKELENAIADNSTKYIIIDEIGPMQLFSEKYKDLLVKLLDSKKEVIGTIFMNSYEWLDDFKKNKNIKIIDITFENRDELPLEIVKVVTKNNHQMQRKIDKAIKYSSELERFNIQDDKIIINSEHGTRTIKKENNKYVCDCDFYKENGTCSHIMTIINTNLDFNKQKKLTK